MATPQDYLRFSVYRDFDSGSGETGSEVVAHEGDLLFVTNGAEQRIDIFSISSKEKIGEMDLSSIEGFAGVNSVAVKNGMVVAAVETAPQLEAGVQTVPNNGYAAFFAIDTLERIGLVQVGVLPDMITFSPDGNTVLVANEGEPNPDANYDAPGSISIIDISNGVAAAAATHLNFAGFDAQAEALVAQGVRLFPGKLPSTDFEPEYIAVSPDGSTAFVTLQEANTVAVVDLASRTITGLLPLGTVDFGIEGLDPSDRDGGIDIKPHPVFGLRMPDAIAAFSVDGQNYFATVNEGDDRGETARVKDLTLDPTAFPEAAALQADEVLGRLTVSTIDGDIDGDGDYDQLFAYGSRSFTLYDAAGNVVFDSGAQFERIIAELRPELFNHDAGELEGRSDNKGPEPEALAIGQMGDALYAFIGLERDGGILIYDISEPAAAAFAGYIDSEAYGHVSPEVIKFIPAADSATGAPQLAIAYEVSGTTALIDIEQVMAGGQVSAFAAETEAAAVASVYQTLLGREGDAEGLGYWIASLEAGSGFGDIIGAVLGSEEFAATTLSTSDDQSFVDALYQAALQREGDAEGQAYWTEALAGGASRAMVAQGFLESAEFQQQQLIEIAGAGIDYLPWVG